ncbi:MAG: tetratricopeptide repeat protein [Bacteroidales bacterium]
MKVYFITLLFSLLSSILLSYNAFGQAIDFSPDEAKSYEAEAHKHFEEGNYIEASRRFNNLGFFYWEENEYQKAISNFKESVKANEQIGNVNAIRHIYNNIGQIYFELQQYDSSIEYQKKGLEISRFQNRKAEVASSLINLASTYTESGQAQKAIENLNEALIIATELNELILLRSCYALLSKNYDAINDNEKSKEYYDLYTIIERRIQEEQSKKTREEADRKVQLAEKEKEVATEELSERQKELLHTRETLQEVEQVSRERQLQIDLMEQEKLLREEQIRRQELIKKFLIGGSAFVVIFAIVVLFGLIEKRRANKKIASAYKKIIKQNENITNSIAYAQRIQEAVLPGEENFKEIFSDSFIFFKPRDIVSGDFYWFRRITAKDNPAYENSIVVAAVDCTGHGVPGAFMSLIGVNLLENITRRGIIKPDKILYELHKTIRKNLKQYKNDNRDGMEMSITVISEDFKTLEFAGAKNPLFYITDKKINIIKGDYVPIGGLQLEEERVFTNHKLTIKKPTSIYLFTDGFPDQFGGPKGDKFSTKRLRNLFEQNGNKPMSSQKSLLVNELNSWKAGKHNQLDDILVIGIKLDPS